jgi:hypothetical protein
VWEVHLSGKTTTENTGGTPPKTTTARSAGIFTVKPNMEVVSNAPLASKAGHMTGASVANARPQLFGPVRFPDRVLKSGDTWSGSTPITGSSDLKGVTLAYTATVLGFEMYHDLPSAQIEIHYTYKGRVPAIEAQLHKLLPAGYKLTSSGDVGGSETIYYSLDRGWALNETIKLGVALRIVISTGKGDLEVAGSIDVDGHSIVTGYPAYDASMAPKVTASPN